jgi:hypothetical protein
MLPPIRPKPIIPSCIAASPEQDKRPIHCQANELPLVAASKKRKAERLRGEAFFRLDGNPKRR